MQTKKLLWLPVLLVVAAIGGVILGLRTAADETSGATPDTQLPQGPTSLVPEVPSATDATTVDTPATSSPDPGTSAPSTAAPVAVTVPVTVERTWVRIGTDEGAIPALFALEHQTALLTPDIDGDGDADLVIAGRRGEESVQWLRRTAAGWERYRLEPAELSLEAGGTSFDIDGDGDLDVVFGNDFSGNGVWWWENPSPNFDPEVAWTRRVIKDDGSNKHHDMISADIDGDGTPELIFWNQQRNPPTLWSAAVPADPLVDEQWERVPLATSETELEGLDAGDLDLDGDIDLVAGGTIMYNDGAGGFADVEVISAAFGLGPARIADLIPGGRPEIVFDSGDAVGQLAMVSWDGEAWVTTVLLAESRNGHSLDVADVDGDGDIDILSAELRLTAGDDAAMRLMLNNGDGTFEEQILARGVDNHESKFVDADGDGAIDIVSKPFNTDTPRLDIWLNAPAGTVLDAWTRHVIDANRPERAVFILPGDLDGDGDPDLVTGSWWYKNPGQPELEWIRNPLPQPLRQAAVVADLDGDGDLDIFGTQGEGSEPNSRLAWAQNDGSGNFTTFTNIPNADGDFLQGAVAARFVIERPVQVLLSWHEPDRGVQSLTVPADDPTTTQWTFGVSSQISQDEALSVGDIDGDSDLDVMLGNIWVRNDTIVGTPITLHTPETGTPDRNELVDMDGDGDLDVVVTYEDEVNGRVAWYEQTDDPTAEWPEHPIGSLTMPLSLDVGDIDGDGDIDIVVGEHSIDSPDTMGLFIFENLGNSTSWNRRTVYIGDEHHDGAQLTDIDLDGDLDIVSIGWTHGRVLVYENRSIP